MGDDKRAVFVLVPTGAPPSLRFGHPDVTFGRHRPSRAPKHIRASRCTFRKRHQGTLSGALRSEARKSGAPERVGSPRSVGRSAPAASHRNACRPQNRLVAGHTQQLIRANASPTLRIQHSLSVKSASETASALPVCSSSTRATESTMSVKRIAPAWNAATASSLAALNTAGWLPTLPASLIMRTAGMPRPAVQSPGCRLQPVASRHGAGDAVRPGQTQRDGQNHARWGRLRNG